MKNYTVLLLRPDHVADGFGQDTYLTHVSAETPEAAVGLARQEVVELDGLEHGRPDEYYPLITLEGWHDDLTPEACR